MYAGNVYAGLTRYGGIDLIALDASSGAVVWEQNLEEEIRATSAAADGHVFVGVDTGHVFYKLAARNGSWVSEFERPDNHYFVGSGSLCSADLVFVGNDDGGFYARRHSDLSTGVSNTRTSGYICSTPAVSYAPETGVRWVYVVTRGAGGRLLAFCTQL